MHGIVTVMAFTSIVSLLHVLSTSIFDDVGGLPVAVWGPVRPSPLVGGYVELGKVLEGFIQFHRGS